MDDVIIISVIVIFSSIFFVSFFLLRAFRRKIVETGVELAGNIERIMTEIIRITTSKSLEIMI